MFRLVLWYACNVWAKSLAAVVAEAAAAQAVAADAHFIFRLVYQSQRKFKIRETKWKRTIGKFIKHMQHEQTIFSNDDEKFRAISNLTMKNFIEIHDKYHIKYSHLHLLKSWRQNSASLLYTGLSAILDSWYFFFFAYLFCFLDWMIDQIAQHNDDA